MEEEPVLLEEADLQGLVVVMNRSQVDIDVLLEVIRGINAIKNGRGKGRIVLHYDNGIKSIQINEDVVFAK